MTKKIILLTAALVLLQQGLSSVQGQTLGEALNATNFTWSTSGNSGTTGWTVQTDNTHDGLAAQSGTLSYSSSQSILQTTMTGPGAVTFWWHSPAIWPVLSCVFGTNTTSSAQAAISQTPGWQQQTVYLGIGSQTVKWIYWTSMAGYSSSRAYLDQVSFTPGNTSPFITSQPLSQSQVPGLNTTFTVVADGTPPLSYQWQFNGTNITDATASSFTMTNILTTNLGAYSVIVTNVAGSITSSNATLEFGRVTAWGQDSWGRTSVAPGTSNAVAVSAGFGHSLALRSDSTVVGWGNNYFLDPLVIPAGLTNVMAIASGDYHNLALKADGTVSAWGFGLTGQTNVPPDLTNAVAIDAGSSHSLALKADGTLAAWGSNTYGQTNIPDGLTNVAAIAAGASFNVVLRDDGTVSVWGGSPSSVEVTNIPAGLSNVVAIAAGSGHCMALKADQTVVVWGRYTPGLTNVPSLATNVVTIAAGGDRCLALQADSSFVAWGASAYGLTNTPAGLSNIVAISANYLHNVAIVGDGPPVLSAPALYPVRSGNSFSLTLPSQSGRVFRLEYKDALSDAGWTALPLVAGNGTNLILTDPTATSSQRFYRVRRW